MMMTQDVSSSDLISFTVHGEFPVSSASKEVIAWRLCVESSRNEEFVKLLLANVLPLEK